MLDLIMPRLLIVIDPSTSQTCQAATRITHERYSLGPPNARRLHIDIRARIATANAASASLADHAALPISANFFFSPESASLSFQVNSRSLQQKALLHAIQLDSSNTSSLVCYFGKQATYSKNEFRGCLHERLYFRLNSNSLRSDYISNFETLQTLFMATDCLSASMVQRCSNHVNTSM